MCGHWSLWFVSQWLADDWTEIYSNTLNQEISQSLTKVCVLKLWHALKTQPGIIQFCLNLYFLPFQSLKVCPSWDLSAFSNLHEPLHNPIHHVVQIPRKFIKIPMDISFPKLCGSFNPNLFTTTYNGDINNDLYTFKHNLQGKSAPLAKLWVRSNVGNLTSCDFLEPTYKSNHNKFLGMGLTVALTAFFPLQCLPASYFLLWL